MVQEGRCELVEAVNVYWITRHAENAIARFYWDQQILEDLFTESNWGLPAFSHTVLQAPDRIPPEDRAILVIPARHHATDDDVLWFSSQLHHWSHPVIFLTGDEESAFPIRRFRHPRGMRFWVQTPSLSAHAGLNIRKLGDGYAPGTRENLPAFLPDKPVPLFFSGQITHPLRESAWEWMNKIDGAVVNRTAGFTQGFSRIQYTAGLATAKLAVAPGGPCTPDTFRTFEALEAGCVPIVDNPAYWTYLFDRTPPFPMLGEWSELPEVVDDLLRRHPVPAYRSQAFWINHKRRMAHDLKEDLAHVPSPTDSNDQITVLVPTSPIPSHPDTSIIEATIASIRSCLPRAEILICCDGVRPEQEPLRAAYDIYLARLVWLANHQWANVAPVIFDEFSHQARMTKAVLDLVRTPLILFVEHDTPLVPPIPFDQLIQPVLGGSVNVIRLHHEASILEPHRHLMIDLDPQMIDGVPLLRTIQWSQRPHLSTTKFYRWLLHTYFHPDSRTMIEDVVYGPAHVEYEEYGLAGWRKFAVAVYAPTDTDNIKRSTHLDGRGEEPKWGIQNYPPTGELPLGYPLSITHMGER